MAKYLKTKEPMRKSAKRSNKSQAMSRAQYLRKARSRIYRQALLAVLTVVLTGVILFAMTTAWYTNTVQTSGLVFEAEAWSFDGTITVSEGAIQAAPGDDGVVYLTVANDSDALSAISVNVTKSDMNEQMQRRLYFYVDTQMNRNEETMERVYLNKYEGYTYNVFSKGQLILTEQVSNAPVIKWQWVYDVLGYYVLAQPYEIEAEVTTTNEDGTTTTETVKTTKMSIKEYLRPIEYDFDEATTVVNTDGEYVSVDITTVDGENHPEVFLYYLSQKDGYEGTVTYEDKVSFGNYYEVDVDEDGYGVYAYLCNYSDIMMETQYDTQLGELAYQRSKGATLTGDQAELLSQKATLILSAQKSESDTVNVNTLGALQSAINLNASSIIQLSSNITIPEDTTLTVPENTHIMLDLNNYKITSMSATAIKANPGSSLTMIDGFLENNISLETEETVKTYGIYATGAEVTMNNVDIDNYQYGVYVGDQADSNELDSRVYMLDCDIEADVCAVFISGNGVLSEQKSQLIIENSTLQSSGIVVSGNGDSSGNGRWGTDIQIINSKIIATTDETGVQGFGIYHPQKSSTMTIYNSTVEGYNGVTIKGGDVSIQASTIIGTGKHNEPSFEGNGFTETGDAVYIETSYGYNIWLDVGSNSVLTHQKTNSQSLRVFNSEAINVYVEIESCTLDEEQPDNYIAEGYVQSVAESTDSKTGKRVVVIPEDEGASE